MLSLAYRALVKKVPCVLVTMLFIVHKNSCLNVQNVVQLYDTPTFQPHSFVNLPNTAVVSFQPTLKIPSSHAF